MDELLSQTFHLILEIPDRLNEELISIIEDDDHLFSTNLVQTVTIIGIAKFSDLIELVSEHVLISYIIKIDKKVDLVYPSFDKIGCCFYSE